MQLVVVIVGLAPKELIKMSLCADTLPETHAFQKTVRRPRRN